MNINKKISKYNFNSGSISRIKYIVIHYVGALGGAEANCDYYCGGDRNASSHYFVGFAGEIWQCVEDQNIAWHCGATKYVHPECRNANSIGVELCVRKRDTSTMSADDKDWYFEDITVKSAIELTKYLMDKYNVPVQNVVRHYDVTGKICPNPFVYDTGDYSWAEFKAELGQSGQTPAPAAPTPAAPAPKPTNNDWMRRYQQAIGARVDGIAGPETLKKSQLIKEGSRGSIVSLYQERINALGYNCGKADAIFGKNTKSATIRFQAAKGLSQDGIVGVQTWKKILGL